MVSAGMMCVKYLLFCFNLLFTIAGIGILTVGVISHLFYSDYSSFTYPSFQIVPLVLIAVGVIIFIVAFLGCCGAAKENQCMISMFAVFLIVIFVLEITAGVFGYIHRNEVDVMLEDKLNSTISYYYKNEEIRHTWDIAQHEGECCGINGPTDWQSVTKNDSLPHTCCPNTADDGSCTMRTETHYTASCYDKLKILFSKNATIIESVALGISLLQIFGIVFACSLRRAIRHEYETV
ncbi:CD63 antigen-like [Coccinella septempunctata]|uniref:CD63 antigen-like n=1 Tax=Coccinella septempunctata TaxID=41139 RepID=UPI001D065BAC|nr:CD63 antigen-like [Coccinella septempunctata]